MAPTPSVLIVDDELNLRRTLALGLRIEGFDAEAVGSGDAALAALARRTFDLALVDLMMPGVHGLELARRLRELHPSCRVVLTSAYHLSERQLVQADCGAIAFVPKPYDIDELARFLRSKLSSALVA